MRSPVGVHRIGVRRTARYCTLGGGVAEPRTVWYVLHGYRQLAERFIERFRPLAAPERLIVAPEALNRFYLDDDASGLKVHGADAPVGATWMTRYDRETEIADYVGYLDALDRSLRLPRAVRRIVLGFSQGSQTAARWALLGRRRVDRLVLWGGVLPADPPLDASLRRLRLLQPVFVSGARDPSLRMERVERECSRLVELGVETLLLRHDGGHTVDPHVLEDLAAAIER